MIEGIKNIINFLGTGNALTILIFFISIFIAFYLHYKSFFRLTYATGRICRNCNETGDWTNNETEFVTRIIFFNNGRKTITKNEILKLELVASNKIISVKTIKGSENIEIIINSNIVNINFDYIDSSEFFVLEINHSGKLEVKGRIFETGNLLNTEPRYWTILNIIFIIFFFVMMFDSLTSLTYANASNILTSVTNFFILFGIFSVIRFIHSILFIPYSVTSKYLDTKDKFVKEFKN